MIYSPASVQPACRVVVECKSSWREWRGRRAAGLKWGDEDGIRVWSLPPRLERTVAQPSVHLLEMPNDHQIKKQEQLSLLIASLERVEGVDVPEEVSEEYKEREGGAARVVKAPLAYQRLGKSVWEDSEPQSHRGQHPWLLAHTRESTDTVKKVLQSIVDPQVEDLRSFSLVTEEETLDMRTEMMRVEETGHWVEDIVDGQKVRWERKLVVMVPRESGPQFLAAVAVRRTGRQSGFRAGRGGDQARLEDLAKPVLVVAHACGHLQAISADIQMAGMDTKLIRMINQRTGSYCYVCTATAEDAHNVEKVTAGFSGDRLGMEELVTLSRELMKKAGVQEEEMELYVLDAVKGDAKSRCGIKSVPLSTVIDSTSPFAVLHTCLLRLFAFSESLIIR